MKKIQTIQLSLLLLLALPCILHASLFQRDPIEETRSDVVPVTEELLSREGELGPASPTFKLNDTSDFLTKVPFGQATEEEEVSEQEPEEKTHWWDEWFSWGDEEEK